MIRSVRPEDFQEAYGILCTRILPMPGTAMPFGSTWCAIEPGGTTSPHDHFDGEVFIVLKGKGRMAIQGDEEKEVGPGDVIFIRPHRNHTLTNLSKTERLEFLSVFWDHASELFSAALPERSLIIAAPPTPNGDLHVGHLSGPYLAADIYRRYLTLKGKSAHFLCGSDDHQSYVPTKAAQLKTTPTEVVDRFSAAIQKTLGLSGIRTDQFVRPLHDPAYKEYVQSFFLTLVDKGAVRLEPTEILFCKRCDIQVFEAHVSGKCPHCGVKTNGHGCEQCGLINDATDLGDPVCNHCQSTPEKREELRHRFHLEEHRSFLAGYHQRVKMNDRLKSLGHRLRSKPLPSVSASFKADWGIPVPGSDGLVIYEWLEMAAGYRYIAEQLRAEKDWNPFSSDPLSEIVLFFGFDNSFFYSTYIPAILNAYDPDAALPRALVTNEFYRLEGLKFSTSRNHAIWGKDLLADLSADAVRFHLSKDRPEHEQTNFELASLRETVADMTDRWDGWLRRLDSSLSAVDRKAPAYAAATSTERMHHARIRQLVDEIDRYYRADHFSPRAVTSRLDAIVDETESFAKKHLFHREHNPTVWESGLALELAALKALATAALPVMPGWSSSILAQLTGAAHPVWDADVNPLLTGTHVPALDGGLFAQSLLKLDSFIRSSKT